MNNNFDLCVPCLLGLEGPIADELKRMKLDNVRSENGRVYFKGGAQAIAKANINLRIGERVLVELGRFEARSFDELFEKTKALPWEMLIPRDAAFPVKGYSLNSKLFSVSDCQKIIKKAVVERLKSVYGIEWFDETAETYQIQFSIMKDVASLCIDTSGAGLHKRGYRPAQVAAPLRETLAAAIVDIARYRGRGDFCDPFCGSGTIAIEAALAALNRAPGSRREFAAEAWRCLPRSIWQAERSSARSREYSGDYHIFASDIDPRAVALARENARRAGVEKCIEFSVADARDFSRQTENGTLCTNPPYGERLLEKEAAAELMRAFGKTMRKTENWKTYVISSLENFENVYGKRADKRRRLYNGMIPCQLYMYL